jgi:ABC-type multidrug transport system fused ATPase/permease subunit
MRLCTAPPSLPVHTFASGLPAGYDTVIGDGGRSLSVGERRRVALARAFLRDAPLSS